MTTETKYNLNQLVFFMKNNTVAKGRVMSISYTTWQTSKKDIQQSSVHYGIKGEGRLSEVLLYASKEELLKTL